MSRPEDVFQPVLGRKSWLVRKGHGSFITLEFGDPDLRIGEPRMMPVFLEGVPPTLLQRHTSVHGQWHLWIYCCDCRVTVDDWQLAHNESEDIRIARALRALEGQALTKVTIHPADGRTEFDFDLGGVLTTSPAPPGVYRDPAVEQWMFFEPSGDVLTVRADGRYSHGPGSTKPEAKQWRRPGQGPHLTSV